MDPVNLVYIPAGEYAFCYAFDATGLRYFAKIWPEPRPGYVSTESTLAMLKLTRALYDRGAFTAQAAPMATKAGALHTTLDSRLLALFPFIAGGTPVESAAFAAEFGRLIAALQLATPVVADLLLRREALDIPFAARCRARSTFRSASGRATGPGDVRHAI